MHALNFEKFQEIKPYAYFKFFINKKTNMILLFLRNINNYSSKFRTFKKKIMFLQAQSMHTVPSLLQKKRSNFHIFDAPILHHFKCWIINQIEILTAK
jgi:hypothetical protein